MGSKSLVYIPFLLCILLISFGKTQMNNKRYELPPSSSSIKNGNIYELLTKITTEWKIKSLFHSPSWVETINAHNIH